MTRTEEKLIAEVMELREKRNRHYKALSPLPKDTEDFKCGRQQVQELSLGIRAIEEKVQKIRKEEREKMMKLFRVEVESATYWVLGEHGTPSDMIAAIEETEEVTFENECWEKPTADDIREVGEEEARTIRCGYDDGPSTDMWTAAEEHQRTGHGRVVACSEWG